MDNKNIRATHYLKGWFNGALETQEEGELWKLEKATPGAKQNNGSYLVTVTFDETLPDGEETQTQEYLYLEPLNSKDPKFRSYIIPIKSNEVIVL